MVRIPKTKKDKKIKRSLMKEITFYLKDNGNNKLAFKGGSLPFGVFLTKMNYVNTMELNTFTLKNKTEDMLFSISKKIIY